MWLESKCIQSEWEWLSSEFFAFLIDILLISENFLEYCLPQGSFRLRALMNLKWSGINDSGMHTNLSLEQWLILSSRLKPCIPSDWDKDHLSVREANYVY